MSHVRNASDRTRRGRAKKAVFLLEVADSNFRVRDISAHVKGA